MIIGDWIIHPLLHEGELLSSYLVRCAHAHGSTAYRFLHLFWPNKAIWNRDVDRTRDDAWIDDLARATGIPPERLRVATLTGLLEKLNGRVNAHGDLRFLLSSGIYHRTRRRHGVQFCPECLAESKPWFRQQWRLGFVVWCERHRRRLLDACPHCDAPVILHRTPPGALASCHACNRSLLLVTERHRDSVVPAEVTWLQSQLVHQLTSGTAELFPRGVSIRDSFCIVRAIISVVANSCGTKAHDVADDLAGDRGQPQPRVFERLRVSQRIALLSRATPWLRDWPTGFRTQATTRKLSRRRFRASCWPPALEAEINRLPPGIGQTRIRTHLPLLHTSGLRRLQRDDPTAYRYKRASRLMALSDPKD